MKRKSLTVYASVVVLLLSLGFIHSFISSAQANCSTSSSGSDDSVTCTNDTSGNDIDTGDGNDHVNADNSQTGDIRLGNDNDSATVANDSSVDGDLNGGNGDDSLKVDNGGYVDGDVLGGNGNDTITVQDARLGDNAEGGDNNDLITVDHSFVSGNVDGNGGDDTVNIHNSGDIYDVNGGFGNDSLIVTGNSTLYGHLIGGNGDDTLIVGATINGDSDPTALDAGSGNDVVTLVDGAKLNAALNGGNDYDVLQFRFTVGSQDEKDAFGKLLAQQDAACGFIEFKGQTFYWQDFEELQNLLRVLQANGSSVTVTVLADSRLNQSDAAAPIAVYCNAGSIEVWVVDPTTGNGSLGFRGVQSALPVSINGIGVAISGDQIVTSFGGYAYNFPAIICPG